jgi:hypothetical protein
LNFLRSPENFQLYFQLNLENHFVKELEIEAEFYGLADRMFLLSPAIPEQDRMLKISPTLPVQERMSILSPAQPVQERMSAIPVQERMSIFSPTNPVHVYLSPTIPVQEVQFDFYGGTDVFVGENPIIRETRENIIIRKTRENRIGSFYSSSFRKGGGRGGGRQGRG